MNTEKLNSQHLISGITEKTGETKKDADLFLREFVTLVQNTLFQDKIVKVKGLGVFKLQWNESRKSINVQTGEEIEIAGHYKISFSPETELKNAINEPFAHLETIFLDEDEQTEELPNPLAGLSIQAQEIASMIAEIKSMPVENQPEEETKPVENQPEEETNSFTDNIITEVIMEQVIPPQPSQEQYNPVLPIEITTPVQEEIIYQQEEIEKADTENVTEENPPKKKRRIWLWILLILLALLIAGAVVCYFTPDCKCYVSQYIGNEQKPSGTIWADSITALEQEIADKAKAKNEDKDEEQAYYETETVSAQPYPFDISDYQTKDITVGNGGRLAQISRVHYGNYIFWGYIYLANRDKLSSPNDIEPGMTLRIPKLPKTLTDTNNHYAMEQAQYINSHLDEY